MLPSLDPVFVNRRSQLQLFDSVLESLDRGERRHIALIGLRRIGKTMLLDEVRARHPDRCIVKLPVDSIVTTPEDFALEVVAAVLQAATASRQLKRTVTTQPTSILASAAVLGETIVPYADEILDLVGQPAAYGRLLAKVLGFPAAVSEALDLPMFVILDEFQDIRRLQNFKHTENLWAAIREALDRRGRVAFAIAGSIVTTLRKILHQGNDPLFTRFHEVELSPFSPEDSEELATGVWERGGLRWDQNAVQRLQALSQGFPFYGHTLAISAGDLVRGDSRVTGDHVDLAFQLHLLSRDSTIAIYCQYLFEQAIGDVRGENLPEAVLRRLAAREGMTRTALARSVRRANGAFQVHRIVGELVDIDILADRDGGFWFVDPILPIWIALDRERRDPAATFANPEARLKVIAVYDERLRALQEAMGSLFESRVHNVLRQFRGQTVSGRPFGRSERMTLPRVDDVRGVTIPDPAGRFSGAPGSVEIDAVATDDEVWLVEAKHRAGGVTPAMVDRFSRICAFYVQHGGAVGRRWYVSRTGFRTAARVKCELEGILYSTSRDLNQIEKELS